MYFLFCIQRFKYGKNWISFFPCQKFWVNVIKNVFFSLAVLLSDGQTNYGAMAFHWTTLTSSYDMNQNKPNSHNSHPHCHGYYNTGHELHQYQHQQQKQQQHHFLPRLPEITEKTVVNEFSKKWNHCPLTPPKLRSLVDLDRRGSGVNSANNFYRNVPAPPNTALAFSK